MDDPRAATLFRRLATRGKLGLGESYTAGEWDADDLVAFFELLLRERRGRRPTATRACGALMHARPRLAGRNGLPRRAAEHPLPLRPRQRPLRACSSTRR